MEFLRSFLRRHLTGKPVVASPNVGCLLRLINALRDNVYISLIHVAQQIRLLLGCKKMLKKVEDTSIYQGKVVLQRVTWLLRVAWLLVNLSNQKSLFTRLLTTWFVARPFGKTRNIAFQSPLHQCCKTICTFLICCPFYRSFNKELQQWLLHSRTLSRNSSC